MISILNFGSLRRNRDEIVISKLARAFHQQKYRAQIKDNHFTE